ncbi:MAG: disulfide bond formation protein B [Ectothiorhodospiraceae bacterium]|jgi:disulfide bond formation protein DsbB
MLNGIAESRRQWNLAGFAVCVLLLGAAYYLQFVQGMEPCPLCIFQRVAVFGLAIVFLIAGLHAPKGWGSRVYAVLLLLVAGAGTALSVRHLWLQSLPADQVPACGPGLDYMLNVFPLWDTVRMVLTGSGECAEVDLILGVTLPAWTLAVFLLLGTAGIVVNWVSPARRPART